MDKQSVGNKDHVFRVDKFGVPEAGREEFLGGIRLTYDILRKQPGFLRDILLEQEAGPDEFTLVTLVEWESERAVEQAREAVNALHREIGFDPLALRARLGIRVELGTYRAVGI